MHTISVFETYSAEKLLVLIIVVQEALQVGDAI